MHPLFSHLYGGERCVAAFEALHFSVRGFGHAFFYDTGFGYRAIKAIEKVAYCYDMDGLDF